MTTDGRRTAVRSAPARTAYRLLLRAAAGVAALLVLAAAGYVVIRLLVLVAPMTMAIVVALLLTAMIGPLTRQLGRIGLPRSLTAATGVLVLLGIIAGASYLVGRRTAGQLDDLQLQVVEGLRRLRRTVISTVPGVDEQRLDEISASLVQGLRNALPSPFAGVTTAAEALAAVLLAIVLLFFFLRDGEDMWAWVVARLPGTRSRKVDQAGRSGWRTLASYTHGIIVVAAVDAVGIGAVLFLLDVPLALSLALLTFLSAFVPIIGATLAGAVATLVTLVTNGTTDALIVLAAVIVVQQAEGNLLHPIIMRRAVSLHPVVTLLAVTGGTLIAGIAGALVAVPACAVAYHATLGYRSSDPDAGPDTPGPGAGSGGSTAAHRDEPEPEPEPGGTRGTGRAATGREPDAGSR